MIDSYTYTVDRIDAENGVMEISYAAEGKETLLVGAPMPRGADTLELIVKRYAPIAQWNTVLEPLVDVQQGFSGAINVASAQPSANIEMWADIAFQQSIAKVLVKFGLLAQDPTTIGVTSL